MGENICKPYIWQGLKELEQLNGKKNKYPVKKIGERPE